MVVVVHFGWDGLYEHLSVLNSAASLSEVKLCLALEHMK